MAERIAGYRRALDKFGIPAKDGAVMGAGFDPVAIRSTVRQLVKASHRPSAILIVGGYLYVPCTAAIRAAGLSVPGDLFPHCVRRHPRGPAARTTTQCSQAASRCARRTRPRTVVE